jgi:hypothetical protein
MSVLPVDGRQRRLKRMKLVLAFAAAAFALACAFLGPLLIIGLVGKGPGKPTYDSLTQICGAVGATAITAVMVVILRRYERRLGFADADADAGADGGAGKAAKADEVEPPTPAARVRTGLALPDPAYDRRIGRFRAARTPLVVVGVIGGLGGAVAIVLKAMNRDEGLLFTVGLAGLFVMICAALLDWLVCQHEIFRLRLRKAQHLGESGRVRFDEETAQWLARQGRLHRVDRWVSRAFILTLLAVIIVAVAKLPGFGVALGAFVLATIVYVVEFVVVQRKLARDEILFDVTDIKSIVSKLTGGVIA